MIPIYLSLFVFNACKNNPMVDVINNSCIGCTKDKTLPFLLLKITIHIIITLNIVIFINYYDRLCLIFILISCYLFN